MLSTISDDCVLAIFSYLNVINLDEMCCVSRRMQELALFQLIRTPKRRALELRIVESEQGHAFQLFNVDNELNYAYMIDNEDKNNARKENRFLYKGRGVKTYYQMLLQGRLTGLTKHQTVPPLLLSRLEKLTERISYEGLVLKNIKITSSLMSYLEGSEHNLDWIDLLDVKVDNDCKERLVSFLMKKTITSIEIGNLELEICKMFNESFVRAFGMKNDWKDPLILNLFIPDIFLEACLFYPPKDAIEYIARYEDLYIQALVLHSHWVPELLEKRLKLRKEGIIVFSMLGDLHTRLFEAHPQLVLEVIDTCTAILKDNSVGTQVLFQIFGNQGRQAMHAHFTFTDQAK